LGALAPSLDGLGSHIDIEKAPEGNKKAEKSRIVFQYVEYVEAFSVRSSAKNGQRAQRSDPRAAKSA